MTDSAAGHSVVRTVLTLAVLAAVAAALLAYTHHASRARIEANDTAYRLRLVNELVPPESYNNECLADVVSLVSPALPGDGPVTVFRARRGDTPVAAILRVTTPDGYSGPITIMIAIDFHARLLGVRVAEHRETPGLGDAIETAKSDWILGFNGLEIGAPPLESWAVKRDGGEFDQFTGATVTPRAIVHAVRDTLVYFAAHREQIFALPIAASPVDLGTPSRGLIE